jgi:hypothetical protein
MKLYELYVQHELTNTYVCFEKCFYEFLKIILHIKNSECAKINVVNNDIIIDELVIGKNYIHGKCDLMMYSKYKNITYNIQTQEAIFDFVYLYSAEKYVLSEVLFSLMFLVNKITCNEPAKSSVYSEKNVIEKTKNNNDNKIQFTKKEKNLSEPLNRLAELEKKLMSQQLIKQEENIPSKPTIEKISQFDDYGTSDIDTDSGDGSDLDGFYNDYMEIHEMEKAKDKLKNVISNVEKTIDKEDYDLAVYAGELDRVRILKEKETQKMEDKINQFKSQKNFTYKTIYNDFFLTKKIPSWDDIPPLFSANFAIFLYLDGKDCFGNDVRPRILDTEDEYRMYNLLLLALTDDTFELPESKSDELIIADFFDTLPPLNLLSSEKIMKSFNDPENDLFENDVTSLNSDNINDDKITGNNTYN